MVLLFGDWTTSQQRCSNFSPCLTSATAQFLLRLNHYGKMLRVSATFLVIILAFLALTSAFMPANNQFARKSLKMNVVMKVMSTNCTCVDSLDD